MNLMLSLLKKNGWDESYYVKAGAIILGFSSIIYGEERKKADAAFIESVKEIDSNPHLSEQMKKQIKDQMKVAGDAMKLHDSAFKDRVHPNDMKMIIPYIKDLKRVLEVEETKTSQAGPNSPTRRFSK